MQSMVSAVMFWSVLVPSRQWVPAGQPLDVMVKSPAPVTLLLADFTGSTIAPTGPVDVRDRQTIDLKTIYPSLTKPGTYLLLAVPTQKEGALLAAAIFFQAEDGIRDHCVTGVQTCALPI